MMYRKLLIAFTLLLIASIGNANEKDSLISLLNGEWNLILIKIPMDPDLDSSQLGFTKTYSFSQDYNDSINKTISHLHYYDDTLVNHGVSTISYDSLGGGFWWLLDSVYHSVPGSSGYCFRFQNDTLVLSCCHCPDASALFFRQAQIETKINESMLEGKLDVYPNPTTGELFIRSDESVIGYRIMDSWGQTIDYSTSTGSVNINNLPNGIYYIEFITNSRVTIIRKLIKN
jgi:hypothetical protein